MDLWNTAMGISSQVKFGNPSKVPIHHDPQIPTIQEEIKIYLKSLEEHPNTLAADLTSGHTRRLQRAIPADLFL